MPTPFVPPTTPGGSNGPALPQPAQPVRPPRSVAPKPAAPAPRPTPASNANDVGLRVSLIPVEENQKQDPRQGFRIWVITVIAGTAILALMSGGIWIRVGVASHEVNVLAEQANQIKAQQAAITQEIAAAKIVQNQLKGIGALLKVHRYGTQLLAFFEEHTLPTVAYANATVSESGMVTLSAEAASFEAFAAQIKELRAQPVVTGVLISAIGADYDERGTLIRVRFTLAVTFDDAVFLRATSEAESPTP